ncbi:MAG: DUF1127 domain-containing protein [Litoreibacter sp.]|nr:DUF1127 domain-containing protein [Litoreibacter sp.]MCY4336530.1 DUF1127 domain-containing protein [Litoreibacter sp.]
MAVFEPSRALSEGVRANPSTLFSRVLGIVMDWNDRRVTRNALHTLSERELSDIGLSRSDVENM